MEITIPFPLRDFGLLFLSARFPYPNTENGHICRQLLTTGAIHSIIPESLPSGKCRDYINATGHTEVHGSTYRQRSPCLNGILPSSILKSWSI